MVELYTKRNFRCDCGTAKILAVRCKFDAIKLDQNDKNFYNQNFSGLYCTCHRPYPGQCLSSPIGPLLNRSCEIFHGFADADDSIEDEMIQCILCEDWFHSRHLQATVPASNSFAEMICVDCMSKHDVIHHYVGMSITKVDDSVLDTTADLDVSLNTTEQNDTTAADESIKEGEEGKVEELLKDEINQSIMNIIEINKSNIETNDTMDEEPPAKRRKTETADTALAKCTKPLLVGEKSSGATFWPIDWRKSICRCEQCMAALKEQKIEFLVDLEDTVLSYQEKGLTKVHETTEERAMRAFSQIDRQQQINVLTGYNKLKENLKEFLHSYAVSDVAVTIDDVNRFFRTMNEKDGK